ncbi:MAG: protein kinase [Chloroflexi bacterium]|nr:protein kinase [Chloroflexota bacterium]
MASDRFQRRIDRLFDQIDEAVDQLNWAVVRDRAQAVLTLDPGNADAINFLAAAERALGDTVPETPSQSPSSPSTTATSTTTNQPTSFANGRYQVKRFLGEGGKKKVYLAHDTTLDREVAFALIKAEGLDETSRTRIQREAQAMGRLGSHPHIVTVFDLGEEQGQPYMVTELMGGGDVEGVIEDAQDHRLPLEQAIKIAQQTCRGMEFAHSRGIVHRDLKPGNVWLTEDGTAKIGDFGLAVALDRSRLTTEGMMVGTVSYMPPEQAMGGEVTPRSDLYSLGAMLYEMVTGRPPFLGDDSVAIIGQHINTPPVAPTWHNNQCPRELDALILRLLAKSPSERPESAADVLSALDAIELMDSATGSSVKPAPVGENVALDSLAGGVFVGRQGEMSDLKAALEDSLSGRGRMVMLVGEPGIGKTRTAQELATYASLRGAQVLWGRCYEGQGAPSYWPWVQAIRSYVRDRDSQQLRSEMGSGAVDIAEIVSDVRDKLVDMQELPSLEPEQARFRLFDSITAFLKSAGRTQPLVLILDDLHWADHPSLLLMEFLARELANARLLIIGTYRDMELSRRHPLSLSLGELTRERLFQRVLLRGLSQPDVGRFIELVSGAAPPTGMLEAVHRQTEGNPLFVTEVVRLLVQEGLVGTSSSPAAAGGTEESWNIRIPEGVREVIGRRLDRLTERCNDTLTIASVMGREFTLDHLGPLVEDLSSDRLLEVLEEALAARVIEEMPQSIGRYQFTHALIQETLAEELSTTRKVRLHARIAEALEQAYGDNAEAHAAELAFHFGEAASLLGSQKLIDYSTMAGEQALTTYAHEDALSHFQRGLSAKEDQPVDGETATLLFGRGRAHASMFQRREALDCLTRAFDYYAEAGDVAKAVAVSEFPINPGVGRVRVTPLLEHALALVPAGSREEGALQSRYGLSVATEMGDFERSQEAFNRALEIAKTGGDAALEMRTWSNAAMVDMFFLRWAGCVEKCLKAIELAPIANEPLTEAISHGWAGFAYATLADLPAAQAYANSAMDLAEKLRDRSLLATACMVNNIIHKLHGDYEKSRGFIERGMEVAARDTRIRTLSVMLEYEVGNFAEGQVHLDYLLEIMRQTGPGATAEYSFPAILIPVVARMTGDKEQLDIAKAAAETVLSYSSAVPFVSAYARYGLAFIAIQLADAASAAEQYAAIKELDANAAGGILPTPDRTYGLLAQTMGDLDRAANHFEDSLEICLKAGFRPELAWTCCDYADMLKERNAEGDRAKAIALLDESLAISSGLGMRPLMERVLSRREILGA